MFDVWSPAQLARAVSPLPVSAYFDEKIFVLEQRLIFDAGPGYVGHERMVPELYDFHTLQWQDNARMLVRSDDAVWLMSNICRHRQAIMLEGRGTAKNVVCPIHRWTYDSQGTQIGAPHFPANPCLNLDRIKLESWNGLLFKGPRRAQADLAGMRVAKDLDFSGYVLNCRVPDDCLDISRYSLFLSRQLMSELVAHCRSRSHETSTA